MGRFYSFCLSQTEVKRSRESEFNIQTWYRPLRGLSALKCDIKYKRLGNQPIQTWHCYKLQSIKTIKLWILFLIWIDWKAHHTSDINVPTASQSADFIFYPITRSFPTAKHSPERKQIFYGKQIFSTTRHKNCCRSPWSGCAACEKTADILTRFDQSWSINTGGLSQESSGIRVDDDTMVFNITSKKHQHDIRICCFTLNVVNMTLWSLQWVFYVMSCLLRPFQTSCELFQSLSPLQGAFEDWFHVQLIQPSCSH